MLRGGGRVIVLLCNFRPIAILKRKKKIPLSTTTASKGTLKVTETLQEDLAAGMGRTNTSLLSCSSSQLQVAGTLPEFPPIDAPSWNTKTHFALHAQWVRKENTLSLLTKLRQLAKLFPLFITVLLAAGSNAGRQHGLLLYGDSRDTAEAQMRIPQQPGLERQRYTAVG